MNQYEEKDIQICSEAIPAIWWLRTVTLASRRLLTERGIVSENLPATEDVKKVERRLASEERKMLKNKKYLNRH